ncbi:glycoside hydrolase family 5 protein [Dactylosporangium sp. NPDC000244]|uniref:glycoside hydrolase family 5 protein n=1 Tax=Dactylosporangium sp. NPDC000244 TaxID=3154365 RepID=UPI003320BB04
MAVLLAVFGFWRHDRSAARVAAGPANPPASGLHVRGSEIVQAGGEPFLMRGISHPYAWFPQHTAALADIKRLGANTVRVVLTGDVPGREVAGIVARCKENRLVCVLEDHDTTGYGEREGAVTLDRAADYWAGLSSVLRGSEEYVVVNIGNEPYGNGDTSGWAEATGAAVAKVRAAGLRHLLMVDAPNWGQDWSGTMRDAAPAVFARDPQRNTAFSVHMYGVYGTAAKVTEYLDAFGRTGLPLVVGEFGWRHTDGPVAADAVMRESDARGIGYLGWSWSGNGDGVDYLDAAEGFDPDRLTDWGRRLFDGIRATAREAAVFTRASR